MVLIFYEMIFFPNFTVRNKTTIHGDQFDMSHLKLKNLKNLKLFFIF